MKEFKDYIKEQEKLDEGNDVWVKALGHLWMSLVGGVAGGASAVANIPGSIAKRAWKGLTTGDPFHTTETDFKTVMKDVQSALNQLSPSEKRRFQSQFCQIINQM